MPPRPLPLNPPWVIHCNYNQCGGKILWIADNSDLVVWLTWLSGGYLMVISWVIGNHNRCEYLATVLSWLPHGYL